MRPFTTLSVLAVLAAPLPAQLVLERGDFNYDFGIDTHFALQSGLDLAPSGLLPFDPQAGHWDFSTFAAGGDARVRIVPPGGTPYASTFPGASGCGVQELPGQAAVYSYEAQTTAAQYTLGFGTVATGITIKAKFNPPWAVYAFPMQVGQSTSQTIRYSYKVLFITVNVTETHDAQIVAEGTLSVPGVPYPMPCLVMHEYVTIQDSLGSSDDYHGYYWLAPSGFTGSNGVVALQSQGNQSASFTVCRNAFFLSANNLFPESAAASLSVDLRHLSASVGGQARFALDAGAAHAGRDYLLAGGASGRSPGTALPGGSVIGIVRDGVTDYLLANANGPLLPGFRGTLDAAGRARAMLDGANGLPPAAVGLHLDFAFTTLNPYDFQSNVVWVEIGP